MIASNQQERAKRGRVLVIDDDEGSLASIEALLKSAGYEVVSQRSPIGATQLIATQNINAVVVNITSPAMRGSRFTALLSSWERVRELPTVLIAESSNEVPDSTRARVTVALKAELDATLVRSLDRVLSGRTGTGTGAGSGSHSGVVSVRPTLAHYAKAALEAWRGFASARSVPLPTVLAQLVGLRAETLSLGLEQTEELIAMAIELADRCDPARPFAPDIDSAISELLEWLSTISVDRGRAFDRSLALSLHRQRLARALDPVH